MITKQRPITMEPEDIIRQLKAENARLREALEAVAHSACLRQMVGDRCICFCCVARAALSLAK